MVLRRVSDVRCERDLVLVVIDILFVVGFSIAVGAWAPRWPDAWLDSDPVPARPLAAGRPRPSTGGSASPAWRAGCPSSGRPSAARASRSCRAASATAWPPTSGGPARRMGALAVDRRLCRAVPLQSVVAGAGLRGRRSRSETSLSSSCCETIDSRIARIIDRDGGRHDASAQERPFGVRSMVAPLRRVAVRPPSTARRLRRGALGAAARPRPAAGAARALRGAAASAWAATSRSSTPSTTCRTRASSTTPRSSWVTASSSCGRPRPFAPASRPC